MSAIDHPQRSQAEIAVFALLDAIGTMRGLSTLIGFGTREFNQLLGAAAAAEGISLASNDDRRDYWASYVARRKLKKA